MQTSHKGLALAVAGAGLLSLYGCGGGGGGGAGSGSTTSLSVSGTAATGAAIANARVEAKCNGGNGSATTAADGSFTIALTAATLPCTLKVTASTGDLYSIITGSGATANANITPVTHLIVANLVGKDPASYFTAFSSTEIAALTPTAVQGAQAKVVLALQTNGIDASALGDLISGKLVAASAGTSGNALDQLLDALGSKLTSSGVTLAQLTTTVSQTAATATPSGTASVPFELALQPAAATCPALRSGSYRLVVPTIGAAGGFAAESVQKVTINAADPSLTNAAGVKSTLIPFSGSPCRFTTAAGLDMAVAPSGALGMKTADGFWGIGFPEQTIAASELAGDWNFIGYEHETIDLPFTAVSFESTISSAGIFAITGYCENAKTNCETNTSYSSAMNAIAAGGFNLTIDGDWTTRVLAFRSGGGDIMLMMISESGDWYLGTRKRAVPQRVVGSVASGWNYLAINKPVGNVFTQTAGSFSEGFNTVTAINDVNGSYNRDNVTNFPATPVITRPETIFNNKVDGTAREGYRWRKPETGVTNSAGALVNVSEFIDLPLRGMGLNATVGPFSGQSSYFGLSVTKP